MALIPGALGDRRQTWAQAHLPPTRTAIMMSMEPVFAAFFAVLLGGESLTSRMLLGGALVLAAMLVVELVPRRKVEGEVTHLDRAERTDSVRRCCESLACRDVHSTDESVSRRRSGWRKW